MNLIKNLEEIARQCRADILTMTTVAASGHPGGSMSSIDLLVSLYSFANIFPNDPWNEKRDRIVVSHGHISPAVYSTLAAYGFVNRDEVIAGFRHPSSIFEGHITRGIPGVEWTTGNLGQGLSAGIGMAIAGKLKKENYHVFVVMSDGESAKGQVAEARRTARKFNLDNLTVIIDYNDIQISGRASNIMYVDLREEYQAADWNVIEIDGHDFEQIISALKIAKNDKKPTVIIAHTIIGKGVSFMEDTPKYHGKPLSLDEYEKAISELGLSVDIEKYIKMREKLDIREHKQLKLKYEINIDTGNPKIYREKTDNRTALGNAIADLAQLNNNVVAIDCDLKSSVKLDILDKIKPEKLIEIGVQEHNAAALAGALSAEGFVTFFADFGVFGIDETFNQHRLNAINNTNLKVVVTHCGVDVGEDGKTHHALNYISAPLAWFGFKVIVPADPNQTDKVVRYVASQYGNYVVAMGRSKVSSITKPDGSLFFDENYEFKYGKIDVIRDGEDIVIITLGSVLPHALKAVDELAKEGINVGLLNVSCPFDLDEEALSRYARNKVIVVEDHNVYNGLGTLIESKLFNLKILPDMFIKVGIDRFPVSGNSKYLFNIYGLDSEKIKETIKSMI
ncbi:transketolase [Thermosipho melanesiensis]|uniref:Transketolase n=1 Tax=Thermosipho melanesiensis TaxID=46541 RepID=A0ABN4UWU5_9BACT|nr:transketolase [Thermosipho melanesiensis]APT74623.1 transketolase [Thermosipho melanesiensis]OOC35328.1 transketolase [Thermosipho melanesiensis]OOC35546.1 transketolase [Thermosipho melanesiensis]OOC36583.1 transketolase [Thermosipho melanesiensis]OOC40255.1 transketolase [Thermosipho melanesiensis]